MKTLLLLSAALLLLWTGSACAQKPHRCNMPPLLSGSLSVSARDGQDWALAKYRYDAFGQRIRLWEFGNFANKSFGFDMLFLFRKGVVYSINYRNKTCQKNPLRVEFHPSRIPQNATLESQVILGGSSDLFEGLLINTWVGDVPKTQGKYRATVTALGCIPVTTYYYTKQTGWIVTNYFNAVKGIEDLSELNPPPFCDGIEEEDEELDFFSAFISHTSKLGHL